MSNCSSKFIQWHNKTEADICVFLNSWSCHVTTHDISSSYLDFLFPFIMFFVSFVTSCSLSLSYVFYSHYCSKFSFEMTHIDDKVSSSVGDSKNWTYIIVNKKHDASYFYRRQITFSVEGIRNWIIKIQTKFKTVLIERFIQHVL